MGPLGFMGHRLIAKTPQRADFHARRAATSAQPPDIEFDGVLARVLVKAEELIQKFGLGEKPSAACSMKISSSAISRRVSSQGRPADA